MADRKSRKIKIETPEPRIARNSTKAALTDAMDTELYDGLNGETKYAGYNMSIAAADDDADMEDTSELNGRRLVSQYTATKAQLNEFAHGATAEADILMSREKQAQIQSRETDYQKRRYQRELSPERDENGDIGQSYKESMRQRRVEREEARVHKVLEDRDANGYAKHEATLKDSGREGDGNKTPPMDSKKRKRARRWGGDDDEVKTEPVSPTDSPKGASKRTRFDAPTPASATPKTIDVKPQRAPGRWDAVDNTVSRAAVPDSASGSKHIVAPAGQGRVNDIAARNAMLEDLYLDAIFPPKTKYKVLTFPETYFDTYGFPRTYAEGPVVIDQGDNPTGGYYIPPIDSAHDAALAKDIPQEIPGVGDLAHFREEDMKYFGKLMDKTPDSEMTVEELKERKIMRLILKIKNGTPPMRKGALRQITDNARQFGPTALFNQLLPLLMERTLEDQERHLLVKVVDRILYKLGDLVRPFTHKILVVIEPLLIDQDYYARVEGREIISNLAKAAGMPTMIATMRPDLDHSDEYVRNTTARAFAVVAQALGIPSLVPFLRAVCRSQKSWHARHTGVKIIQQIPTLIGCAVLPHLRGLVEAMADCLFDEQQKVRMSAAMAISALAEAASPYGIESFQEILNPLWGGCRKQRGKTLATFLKAVGSVIPLMGADWADYYIKNIMEILLREMQSNDEDMRRIVLKVISQCVLSDGISADFLNLEVTGPFFKAFWVRRTALDRKSAQLVIQCTLDLAQKAKVETMFEKLVYNLKDESEAFRKMSLEMLDKVLTSVGPARFSPDLEGALIDGLLFVYVQENVEDAAILDSMSAVITGMGERMAPYLSQITSTVLWRMNNAKPNIRQEAADMMSRIAPVLKSCGSQQQLSELSHMLYEWLGEEYPDVLGSILGAFRAIINVIGMESVRPGITEIMGRLTPILRNRHEKVQENAIDLVGRIAERASSEVSAREWMRICFELIEMLKAHKKGIRRAANNTFGYIAKAVGPSDVLNTLLWNLRTQERQSRVCTAVAIGIVAETCSPYTVLPSLMVEYRVPELNVQNGVLKALSFMFEYIGDVSREYIYSVVPLLEDALIDRDQVHRQTAASVVKHLAIGCIGLGCEDAMIHFLNLLWPNIFETSPHVIDRIIEAIDGVRNALGTHYVMNYLMAGLFHPARKVRTPCWRIYNDAYVQSADAMVPCYPDIKEPSFVRHELDIFI